jgi:hypothetical protein
LVEAISSRPAGRLDAGLIAYAFEMVLEAPEDGKSWWPSGSSFVQLELLRARLKMRIAVF